MAQPLANEPRDLLLVNGDLFVGTDLAFARGITGVAQSCRIVVQMFAEEWFLDLDLGIPYFQSILGRSADAAVLIAKKAYRDQLRAVDGVLGIPQLDATFERATRTLTVTWQVTTATGDTPPDTIVISPQQRS